MNHAGAFAVFAVCFYLCCVGVAWLMRRLLPPFDKRLYLAMEQ